MTELYTGPKFKTVFVHQHPPKHKGIAELAFWCSKFHLSGLTPAHQTGTAGNLSFRNTAENNSFIITRAGLKVKEKLSNAQFVLVKHCDIQKKIVYAEGTGYPSSESMMHYAIYSKLPEITAVFHGHHQNILAHVQVLNIPVTDNDCEYGSTELIESIMPLLGRYAFFIIREHGFISLGRTMDEAGNQTLDVLKKTESFIG